MGKYGELAHSPDASSFDQRRVVSHRQADQGGLVLGFRLLPRPQRLPAREAPLRRFYSAARSREAPHRNRFFAQHLHGRCN